MKLLITGASGFAGRHFLQHLHGEREKTPSKTAVHALVRSSKKASLLKKEFPWVSLYTADLLDAKKLSAAIRKAAPTHCLHLAAESFPAASWRDPARFFRVNLEGTLHLLLALKREVPNATILFVSSAEVYGPVPRARQPISEETPLAPISPYGVSKSASELLCLSFAKRTPLHPIIARPFNHTGPAQPARYALPSFARQIVAIQQRKQPPFLKVGNLRSIRDISDVRDIVHAYWLLLHKGKRGEIYNLCSGKAHSMRKVLRVFLHLAKIQVAVREKRDLRPSDIPYLRGDPSKLRQTINFVPHRSLKTICADLLEYWRSK